MDNRACLAAVSAFAEALSRYLRTNAGRAVSIAGITGQDRVPVSVRVLFRGHNPLYGFPRAVDALSYLVDKGFDKWVSARWGWSFERIRSGYLIIPLSWLRSYLGKSAKDLQAELAEFCEEVLTEKGKGDL